MRQHPIGTGPFKFVEFKPNEFIKVTRNPDYWKKDRPYLDGIEYQIIKNVATGSLAFVSGKVDMTSLVLSAGADAEGHQQADGAGALPHGADRTCCAA